MIPRRLLPLAFACLSPAAAVADPPTPVDAVIVTATRIPLGLSDAPDAHVIEAGEIALRQATFAADILRLIPGITVSDDGAFGGVAGINIRGAGDRQDPRF